MVSGQISDMQRNLRENLDNFAISIVPADGPAQQDAMTFDFLTNNKCTDVHNNSWQDWNYFLMETVLVIMNVTMM